MVYHDDCVEFWGWITRNKHDTNYLLYYLQNSAVNEDNIKKIHVEYKLDTSNDNYKYSIPTTSSKEYSTDKTMGTGWIYNIFGGIRLGSKKDTSFHIYIYRIWFE